MNRRENAVLSTFCLGLCEDGIMEYPELEGTHKDYGVQLLVLPRTSQQSPLGLGAP